MAADTIFNKAILDPVSDTTGSQSISLAASETRDSFGYTDTGMPGADGVRVVGEGDFTISEEPTP